MINNCSMQIILIYLKSPVESETKNWQKEERKQALIN